MSEAFIQIVDENDHPLRGGTMDEVQLTPGGLWHRIARVMCVREDGKMLLQKRGEHEFSYPGCWDTSVSGHVDEGEAYETAAEREGEEEIGLRGTLLKEVDYYSHERFSDGRWFKRFIKIFEAQVPADFEPLIDGQEVSHAEWFTRDGVKDLVIREPDLITDGLKQYVDRSLNNENHTD